MVEFCNFLLNWCIQSVSEKLGDWQRDQDGDMGKSWLCLEDYMTMHMVLKNSEDGWESKVNK